MVRFHKSTQEPTCKSDKPQTVDASRTKPSRRLSVRFQIRMHEQEPQSDSIGIAV